MQEAGTYITGNIRVIPAITPKFPKLIDNILYILSIHGEMRVTKLCKLLGKTEYEEQEHVRVCLAQHNLKKTGLINRSERQDCSCCGYASRQYSISELGVERLNKVLTKHKDS